MHDWKLYIVPLGQMVGRNKTRVSPYFKTKNFNYF